MGLGVRVEGFRVEGFRVLDLRRVRDVEFRDLGLGFRV